MSKRAAINSPSRPRVSNPRDSQIWLVLACLFLCPGSINGQNLTPASTNDPLGVTVTNVARQVGLTATTVYGDEHKNRYLLETTGAGAAFIDDNDGWQDIFLVNGTAGWIAQSKCDDRLPEIMVVELLQISGRPCSHGLGQVFASATNDIRRSFISSYAEYLS